jgi:hypothetical protein
VNLAFLCSSLAPGQDGVGDYTRSLASACRERGHRTLLIALRDGHTSSRSLGDEEGNLVLRLPSRLPLSQRLHDAASSLDILSPQVVSWQFVPYGYHPKGLVGAEARAFAGLLTGRRSHVMLHELWTGIARGEPWRRRVVGAFQRRGLLRWLRDLSPQLLHTSNPTYAHILAQEGWDAGILPLFGNLPIAETHPGVLDRWLPSPRREAWLVAVTFGTLHPQWEPEATAAQLQGFARRQERDLLLLACGRAGTHGSDLLRRFGSAPGIAVAATGELPPETLSAILQAADCGIAPHPWALLGKSGAAAAMLEHGLPVLVPRDDWHPRARLTVPDGLPQDPLCARLADLKDAAAWEAWIARRQAPAPRLYPLAEKFLSSLGA